MNMHYSRGIALWLVGVCSLLQPALAVAEGALTFVRRDVQVGRNPSSIAVGDLNNDKLQDIAVTLAPGDLVAVLLGSGNGTFQPPRTSLAGSYPGRIILGFLNGDELQDAVTTNAAAYEGRYYAVSILLGNGDGTFRLPRPTPTIGEGPHWDVVSEDFNGDSVMDLAVANYGTPSNPGRYVFILRGNGDGTFQRAGNVEVGRGPSAIAVGDFRGDDHVDLAVANVVSNDLSILLDNGDGTFQSARNYQVGGNPTRLAIGDFTGDGIQDIAAAYNEANVSVLIGNGDGTFQPAQDAVRRKGLITPADLCVGDFNHDGLQDLAIANGSHNTIAVLLSTGDGTFQTPQFFAVGAYPGSITTGDFNGDGLQDIAVTNEFSDTISVLTNTTPDKGN